MLNVLAISLGLTLAAELAFALFWGLRGRRELLLVALVNCLTNPPVVLCRYTATGLWGWPALPTAAVLECAAVAVEWQCYRAGSEQLERPFWFALTANGVSYGLGLLLNMVW